MPSQFGEEELISQYFPPGFIGSAIEVGACDGVTLSTTLWLERAGWRVLCIEPNPLFKKPLSDNRKLVEMVACSDHDEEATEFCVYPLSGAAGVVGALKPISDRFRKAFLPGAGGSHVKIKVQSRTLTSLIDKHGMGDVDFVSIDVDGLELDVLRGLDFSRFTPKMVMVEDPFLSDDLMDFMNSVGYVIDHRVENMNDMFVNVNRMRAE